MVSSCKQILDIESFGCSDKCYDSLNITNACERLGIQSKLAIYFSVSVLIGSSEAVRYWCSFYELIEGR